MQPSPEAIEAAPSRHWEGVLQAVEARHHPDGSTTEAVWFEGLSSWTGDSGPPPEPAQAALTGLAVGLRTFDDREILAIDHLDHWIGAPRRGDTLLPLWLALSPEIPDLGEGVLVQRRANLPFLLRDGSGMVLSLNLRWTLLDQVQPDGGPPSWHLRCEGEVVGAGRDRAAGWVAKENLQGQIKADLLIAIEDRSVIQAEFDWEYTLSARIAATADDALRGDLAQHQHHRGTLRHLTASTGPLPPWGPPGQPYRSPAQILEVFRAAGPDLSRCMAQASPPQGPWAAHLAVAMDSAGRAASTELVTDVPWEGGEACVRRIACGLDYPPGAEPAARWGYTVAWAQGAVQPYPDVDAPERPRELLFFAMPDDPTPEQRERASALFGAPPGYSSPTPLPCPHDAH